MPTMGVGENGEKDADAYREDCSGHLPEEGAQGGGQEGGGVHEGRQKSPTQDKRMSVPDALGCGDAPDLSDGSGRRVVRASCSWCGIPSAHLQVDDGSLLRGARFICGACGKSTGLCSRFASCGGAAKSSNGQFIDPLCALCLDGLTRSIRGNDLLEKISGSPLSALDKGKEQAEQAANFLKGKGEELGKTLASSSQELTANLSSTLSSWASLRQPGQESQDGKPHHARTAADAEDGGLDGNAAGGGDSADGDGESNPRAEGGTISGDGGGEEAGGRGGGRGRGKGGQESGAAGGEEGVKGVEKPWETVRDALLSWQGPDRVFIDRCDLPTPLHLQGNIHFSLTRLHNPGRWRVHLSREGFVTRWLNSSRGDIKMATEKLIKHLRWRCEWKLDEMELEDWSNVR
jgi:hypothetical protein